MAYQKTVWKDQDVENPRTYVLRDNGDDTTTLLDAFGTVTELGTPVNAQNMNHIENGIADLDVKIDNILNTIYPVGSLYIGTQSTCPMAALISGSTWELVAENRALWGGDGTNANTTIAAGLPNITGTFGGIPGKSGTLSEAFSTLNETIDSGWDGTEYKVPRKIYFDASGSNSIYGNSDTVQPPAYVVNIWRRTA
ncbi:MAG: hypothetical protein IJ077_08485 [Eubacterium sp.]|nr:hypothetical protein [Eubacterium sp.]